MDELDLNWVMVISSPSIAQLIERAQADFLDLPGLSLTEAQACRLWALQPGVCAVVLGELCERGFLARAPSGRYGLADELRQASQ